MTSTKKVNVISASEMTTMKVMKWSSVKGVMLLGIRAAMDEILSGNFR